MKKILSSASNEEQYQTIGVIGREAIITVAQQVYNPGLHPTLDGTTPSKTDAKRMLDAYIIYRLPGKTNDELRKFARSSLDLANKITHDRTANYEKAEMCITAVSATVSIIHSLSKSE